MKKQLLLLLFGAASFSAEAQLQTTPQIIAAGGGFDVAGNISISYTIGEMTAVETAGNGNIYLTQGFQQPEAGAQTGVGMTDISAPGYELLAYPNPNSGQFFLHVKGEMQGRLLISVLDATARLTGMLTMEVSPAGTTRMIDLRAHAPGLYLLRIESEDYRFSKTLRIQKF